jgi:hypothetical protein
MSTDAAVPAAVPTEVPPAATPLARAQSWGPAKSPPGRRRAHARDVIRLREFQRRVDEGASEDAALREVLLDPKIGLKTYQQDPARLDRPGETARALGALLERAAPQVLERVRSETETALAASAGDFAQTLRELARGEGMQSRDDAAVGRVRVEAAVAGLGVLGLSPRGGGRAPLVQVNNLPATQAHVASAQEAEAYERTLAALIETVESLLAQVPDAAAREEVERLAARTGLRLRAARRPDAVVS